MKDFRKISAYMAAGFFLLLPAAAVAASQGFNVTDSSARQGMLMSLTADAGVVEPANAKNAPLLVGVLSPETDPLEQQSGQVNVKTDGVADTLVSTLNGDIKVGDRIAPSSLSGIGAKAKGSGWIVGVAQSSLDADTKNAVSSAVTDSVGHSHSVRVASIPVVVKVTYYADTTAESKPAASTNKLQKLADAIAGKHVSVLALVLSFVLIIIGVLSAGMVVNSTIRGSFIAIARQPLTKALIMRKVVQSFAMAIFILVVVVVGAFLLLRVF